MTTTCTHCARACPPDAVYCYYDGAMLSAGPGQRGPVNIGAQPFPAPFVFPGGHSCRNFDQLALACQNHWKAAVDLLQQGYLEKFLAGMGRSDLASAAREAARFPDRDRGLDQFLAKIPSDAIRPPRLAVEPTEMSLGQVPTGVDRAFELRLENRGMRLIYGSISSDSLWLGLGGRGNSTQKLFEFGDALTVPIRLRSKYVQARNKPQQAKLVIDSNAGRIEVLVKMEVPVTPLASEGFTGVRSPRQLAEKAKEQPKQAAALFESGVVAQWYRSNNWTYPIQGPSAAGLGAVQQYFETLGLTPPPRVELGQADVSLEGSPGGQVTYQLELRTREKRPIYARAVADQPWLTVLPAQLNGRIATIPLVIDRVPDEPGQTLQANVTIRANGNQRFVVPVKLTIGRDAASPFAKIDDGIGIGSEVAPAARESRPPTRRSFLRLVPAALLAFGLLDVVAYDVLTHRNQNLERDRVGWPPTEPIDIDPKIRLGVSFNDQQRFGFVTLDERDPRDGDKHKRLTYSADGSYNNTCIRVDGDEHLFGRTPGHWARDEKGLIKARMTIDRKKWLSAWDYPGKVRVMQTVMIVPNDDTRPAKLNTGLVHYRVENRDTVPHTVGIRIMLDTYIGSNDGVPFALAGRTDLVTKKIDLRNTKEIPEYLQALEHPNFANPGTTATMVLKFPEGFRLNDGDPPLDPLMRLVICRFPGNPDERWDFTGEKFWDMDDRTKGSENDSCVVLYWPEIVMPAGSTRTMAFSYGLGKITPDTGNGTLALSVPGKPKPGGEFGVTAWVKNPRSAQAVTVQLPEGMSLADGERATKSVSQSNTEVGQVSWKVNVAGDAKPGLYRISATMAGARASTEVPLRKNPERIFLAQ